MAGNSENDRRWEATVPTPEHDRPGRWVRFWCGVMGWHPQRDRERFGFDGASVQARCRRCGYVGLEDSMGCLF